MHDKVVEIVVLTHLLFCSLFIHISTVVLECSNVHHVSHALWLAQDCENGQDVFEKDWILHFPH